MADESFKEGAKAVQEASKAVAKVGEVSQDVGRFIGRALGSAPEDFVGLVFGDYLKEARKRNAARLAQKTDEIFRERGVDPDKLEPINPKSASEFFEAATVEGEEEILDLWATLLANAMDPSRRTSIRKEFIAALKSFDPTDALVFEGFAAIQIEKKSGGDAATSTGGLVHRYILRAHGVELRETQLELSMNALGKAGCLVNVRGLSGSLSSLGRELYIATRRNGKKRD